MPVNVRGCASVCATNLPDTIMLGWSHDQYAHGIVLDISREMEKWPESVPMLIYIRPGETVAYPATTTNNGGTLTWYPDAFATDKKGSTGSAQIAFVTAEDPQNIVGHSKVMRLAVKASIDTSTEPEGPIETWLEQMLQAAATTVTNAEAAEAAAQMAEGHKNDAEAAQKAAEAARDNAQESETAAAQSAQNADADANLSKSWAVGSTGTRTGEDTDNSKYYAGRAKAEAEAAADDADLATQKAQAAARSAADADADSTAAEQARAAALLAKGDAEAAKAAAIAAKETAEQVVNGAIAGIQAEGTAQVSAVNSAGTTQVASVNAAGTTQVGNVNTAGATQVAAVQDKGDEVLDSIPQDYSALVADVSALKSQIAPEYDATATYIKDSFVRKDGKLYHNTEPITTPEAWTASHWREVYVGAELTDLSQRADVLEWLARSRGLTPAQLQQIAASGHADEYFDIGDVIFIPWTDKTPAEPVTYDYPFVVVAFRDCVDANGVTHKNALWIQALYATPQAIAFDAPEQVIADETTFQPDTYYYTKEGSDWHQEEVTVGDPIPSGETYWKHYRSGMAGRIRYGSSDYEESAYRQWLNSDGDKDDWWTAQHPSDVAPAQAATVPGWLTGFTEDWLAIFQPVEVKQAKNTVCDGGETAVMYDKFFLPSVSELYGSQSLAAIEGAYWPYWKEATGLPSPTNGSSSNTNDARKIPQVSAPEGSAVHVRLRSASRSYTNLAWTVFSAGYLYSSYAYSAYRALPACVIFESTNVGA